ncbi:MAG: peptide-methionine (S)-S-oxide reductase MsrA [Myxococcota bacterium]|nr:peptide-methionine (S)-S-oxide reductase MsrA [Myxococcota bacterium]
MWQFFSGPINTPMPTPEQAPAGRDEKIPVPEKHFVLGTPLDSSFETYDSVVFGMGCFWGAEKKFWQTGRVHSTSVGYAGGYTKNPHYREVCSGRTGHAEVVRVIYRENQISFGELLRIFWENHDPTQGMRQGNDVGTEYRSIIIASTEQQVEQAKASLQQFQSELTAAGFGPITTEIVSGQEYYFAEDFHQQYLAKNPGGYCGLGGTGVSCPIGLTQNADDGNNR